MEKSNNYSDEALQEFKIIIEEKITKAQKDLELIRSAYM
ncbi:MAG: molecular chaperone DnaK, partial [Flavobacteriaceae bacterium]|nr:molecular chaperone DnaK [Flavobacteriaceae bacterium]